MKEKIELLFIKIKIFYASKDTIKRVKDTGGNGFATYVADKRLYPKII